MTINTIGWIGSVCLGGCSLPQAVKCYKEGNAEGLSWAFVALWLGGELLTLSYVLGSNFDHSLPLITNYIANIILIGIMVKYKIIPRRKET